SNVGDINGDGIDDFAIGATGVGGASQGAVYVVFGTASGFPANFSLTSIDGTNGFQVNGGEYAQDFVGVSVAGAGDVNNDGIDDLIIGASGADPDGGGSGAAYVLFGKNVAVDGAFASDIATSSLTGTTGFQISGTTGGDGLGFSVAMGDFNGDGIEDLLVGANQADSYRGAGYVIFGKDTGVNGAFAGNIDVATLDGTNGFKMPAVNVYDYAGTSVANAGDVNGDGIDDIAISAMGADPNGSNSGAVYIVYGKSTAFTATVSLSGLDGTNGFRVAGLAVGDQLGISVSSAGDVNDDGVDDLLIGANGLTNNGGAFVVFGRDTALNGNFASNVNVSSLDGTNGFRIDGEASGDNLGIRVSGLGDVNGDGIDDFIVGATGKDDTGSNAGAAYVVFGQATWGATASLAALDGTNGFQINGEAAGDNLSRVGGWGDFNNDGAMDILVSTSFHDAGGNNSGAAWIIWGEPGSPGGFVGTPGADDLSGTAGNDTADGGDNNDILRGLGGDDTLNGGNMSDQLYGGDNNDILGGDAGGDILYGEAGTDTLNGGDGGDKLYGGTGADQLNGGTGNDRMDGEADIDTLNGGAGNDYLDGGAGADVMSGGSENDVYIVDDLGDQTIENANEGYDIVRTALDGWVLSANVEALELQGSADIDGTGNGAANNLQGNSGANTLDGGAGVDTINGNDGDDFIIGGAGNDLLRGGTGEDHFIVAHAFGATLETDQIYDFSAAEGDIMDFSGAYGGTLSVVSSFSKTAGEMTVSFAGGITTVRIDTSGDGKADYQVKINGDVTGETGDWLL
ncbi:MAG: Ca2+-binding protein toxin-related, partial [Caulobacter sp.]|nr:Ca2+-binding protein toxin-related [Caulobacter sp.]